VRGAHRTAFAAVPALEAVRDIRVESRLTLSGLDLVATSVAAFVGGWIIGYLATIT
jgi:hypothetical protein